MLSFFKRIYKQSFIYKMIEHFINKKYRKRLKNDHFTILCPNCIGGVIYNRLGKRFDSPTVNLAINTNDFSYFLENMEYYLSQPVIDAGKNRHGIPCGVIKGAETESIPDITLIFTHYKTYQEGVDKWNERKTRINKENMYVIMYDINDLDEDDYRKAGYANEAAIKRFKKFKCKNKILLTRDPESDKPYAYYIEPNYKDKYPLAYLTRDIFGLNGFEKKWDFVAFLNK